MRFGYFVCFVCLLFSLASCRKNRPGNYPVWGLDVSRHQENVDWEKVAGRERPDFVFIKATEGMLIQDPTYDRHRKALERAGIPWGAYHFFGHRTPGSDQARNFIRTARLKKGNILPVLDIEWHRFMKDPARSVKEAKAFCREIRAEYGANPIIYTSTHFYETYLRNDFKSGEYILWIADYRGRAPELPWTLWQHTESHRIPGIGGRVDRNVFAGTTGEFQKLIM